MKRLCFVVLLFILLAFPANVHADVAPPYNPPGSNPQPGTENTQVRMVTETVVIEVLKDTNPRSLGRAHVTADFTMHNLGTADESMAARFPISVNNGRFDYPEIGNPRIQINGKPVQYRRVNYPDYRYSNSKSEIKKTNVESLPWAEFDVTFPAGQDVSIRVAYDLDGTGYYPATAFYYVLETGAGWKGTIGNADIILRLPYEANGQNVIMDIGTGWATTTPGGVFQGNEVRWHFEDFEPGPDQPVRNMEFALVSPSSWQNVLTARANVAKYPNDSETWGMFAKAHKEVFLGLKYNRSDEGGQELYRLSVEAYEKCLSLNPKDAQWHAGFADLLAKRAYWDSWIDDEWSNPTPETFRALEEIRTALQLAPNDSVVQQIAWEISNSMRTGMIQNGDHYDFPWLTQTPTSWPTLEPTMTPADNPIATTPAPPPVAATEVAQVIPTLTNASQATPTPAPQKASPLCGSAALLPVVVMLWFVWKRR